MAAADDSSAPGDDTPDDALLAAFSPPPPAPEPLPASSVLARLGGRHRPLVLRAAGGEIETPVTPRSAATTSRGAAPVPRTEGRYRVLGEIARGGVGVVLKGHDDDLGRDVAMKVLRDEFSDDPVVLQRFLEEAQIGGQLQHPGVVPVYELGLGEDRRPYFTMKLIKGRTLSALLSERESPAADRPRFLRIFESVCQTMAYAHARGVIHRDLKPANVMVGAFGEVMVVDWGMGKVLPQGGVEDERRSKVAKEPERSVVVTVRSQGSGSASQVGSVMGTPRYMPPEQARGDVARVDSRSDVFSLGAILCETLTGEPPYVGDEQEAFQAAVAGLVEGAHERLMGCGADEDLVSLATRCLSKAPSKRPRDAGMVAKDVSAYLASVEERARAAQTEAAEARVKAQEERRRRRLSMALGGAIVGLLLIGGGSFLWVDGRRRERIADADRAASAAIEEATRLEGGAGPRDVAAWREAELAADHASRLASTGEASASVRARANEVLERVRAAAKRTSAVAAQSAKDGAMAERLEEIRQDAAVSWVHEETDRAYAKALRDYGIDVDALEPKEAAERIQASSVRNELVIALDDWWRVVPKPKAPRLKEVLRAADDDPWRRRLREKSTVEDLRRLADEADLDRVAVSSLVQLVEWLERAGDPERAARLASDVQRRHPDDFWANFRAGRLHSSGIAVPQLGEAVRYYTAATAVRPKSFAAWTNLGSVYSRLGDERRAMEAARRALQIKPDAAHAHGNLGLSLAFSGELDAGLAESREAVRLAPKEAGGHLAMGDVLKKRGDLPGAITAYREGLRLDPTIASGHLNLAFALALEKDYAGAAAEAQEAIRLKPGIAKAHHLLGEALQLQGEDGDALPALREAIRRDPSDGRAHAALGKALDTMGDLEGATEAFREAVALAPRDANYREQLGVLLSRSGDASRIPAAAAFLEEMRLAPDRAGPHTNLGVVLERLNDLDGAIAEHREAIRLDPRLAPAHRSLGLALQKKGDLDGAVAAHREAVRLNPEDWKFHNDLGTALQELGRHDQALVAYRAAAAAAPTVALPHNNIASALRGMGDLEGSIVELRTALDLKPDYTHARLWLGECLRRLGRVREAAAELHEAERRAPEGSEERTHAARIASRLDEVLAVEPRWPGVLAGSDRPRDAREGLLFAKMGYYTRHYATSARLYREAFKADPALLADVAAEHRYSFACSAALAVGERSLDPLTPADKARLRTEALVRMREELEIQEKRPADQVADVVLTLKHWRRDVDLAGVRDPTALAGLPAPERDAWLALWREVDAALTRLEGRADR